MTPANIFYWPLYTNFSFFFTLCSAQDPGLSRGPHSLTSSWIWPMCIPGRRSEGGRKMKLRYLFSLVSSSLWLFLPTKGPCFPRIYSGLPITFPSFCPFAFRGGNNSIADSLGSTPFSRLCTFDHPDLSFFSFCNPDANNKHVNRCSISLIARKNAN